MFQMPSIFWLLCNNDSISIKISQLIIELHRTVLFPEADVLVIRIPFHTDVFIYLIKVNVATTFICDFFFTYKYLHS